MEPDIHIWGGGLRKRIWDGSGAYITLYPTLCGIHVRWGALFKREPIEPTCMGCILVKFERMAEQDAT
jgi:hypothetical protein